MSTVKGQVLTPGTQSATDSRVLIELYATSTGAPGIGIVPTQDYEILGRQELEVDESGVWEVVVKGNAAIIPANTVYSALYLREGYTPVRLYFLAPNDNAVYWIGDILVDPPSDLPSAALAAHLASTSAHLAANIVYDPTITGLLTATDVQDAIDEVALGGGVGTLAGDVTGAAGANTVAKIRNRTVAATAPTNGQVYAWSSGASQWQPTTIAGGGGSDCLLATTDYGAIGDDATDDSAAIQAWVNGAKSTGVRHRLPAGIYRTPTPIMLDLTGAPHPTTFLEFDPGAYIKVVSNIGLAPTYFTGVTRSGNNVTLTGVPTGHGVVAGRHIEVYCPTWNYKNGDFTVASVTANTITYNQGSSAGTTPDTTHGGSIKTYIPAFSIIDGDTSAGCEIWRPQIIGPGGAGTDPNAASPYTPLLGCGFRFTSRVISHGVVAEGFYANMIIDGADGVNTDHFHHYDIKSVDPGWYGIYVRDNLAGTRDYRFDTAGIGPCQRAGIAVSVGATLPDVTFKDVHFNASPTALLKEGFRDVALPTGKAELLFDVVHTVRSKAEGCPNWAIEGNGGLDKWTGDFDLHGVEVNGGTSGGGSGVNHTQRPIDLTAMTRALTVISATYSRSSSGTSVSGSPVITGLTSNAFTWRDVGMQLVKTDVPAGAWIVAIASSTSVVISNAATGSSTSTCYSKPVLEVGDHLGILSTDLTTIDGSAIIKTLAGSGPFTLTAEQIGVSGTVSSTTGTAGCIGAFRAGAFEHSEVTFSTLSDISTEKTASEGFWDLDDVVDLRITQLKNPNGTAGYSAFPSVRLRNPAAAGALRTVMFHGNQEAMLAITTNTIAAGQCTEITNGGARKLSTVQKTKAFGGYALQPAALTVSHPDGATQTSRPTFWVAKDGQYRSGSGEQGIAATSGATGDIMVENPATAGSAMTWDGITPNLRRVGVCTSAISGGFCGIELIPGENWTTIDGDRYVAASVSGSVTVNFATAAVHKLTMTGNITTLTLSGAVANVACGLTLYLVQDATGSRLVTWPASVKWANGVAPTLSVTGSAVDIVVLESFDGGTTWYANLVGKAYA